MTKRPGGKATAKLVLAFLALGFGAPAAAVSAADAGSVVAALVAGGHSAELYDDDAGNAYILADAGEAAFTINFDDCDDDGAEPACRLLVFNAGWEADVAFDATFANRFNQTAVLAHVFVDDDGAINLAMTVAAPGGFDAISFRAVLAWWEIADGDLRALIDADATAAPGPTVTAGRSGGKPQSRAGSAVLR